MKRHLRVSSRQRGVPVFALQNLASNGTPLYFWHKRRKGGTTLVSAVNQLSPTIAEQVVERLGFRSFPAPNLSSLRLLYDAWCRRVPFDNIRKLIALRGQHSGPLPGDDPTDFFSAWLRYGTGGTCWAAHGALHALLITLGFNSMRGVATMLVAPNIPPNHGTLTVVLDEERYLLDASMLHGEPLRLRPTEPAEIGHPAWGIRSTFEQGQWLLHWRPLHRTEGVDCRIDALETDADDFQRRHEDTRVWSPFNHELVVRLNRGHRVTGIAFGRQVEIDDLGNVVDLPLDSIQRIKFLIEILGIDESIVAALPLDEKTPPPPSAAAR